MQGPAEDPTATILTDNRYGTLMPARIDEVSIARWLEAPVTESLSFVVTTPIIGSGIDDHATVPTQSAALGVSGPIIFPGYSQDAHVGTDIASAVDDWTPRQTTRWQMQHDDFDNSTLSRGASDIRGGVEVAAHIVAGTTGSGLLESSDDLRAANYVGTNAFGVYTLENSGTASVAYGLDQSLIYVARRDGNIDVFSTTTHALVTSWTVGAKLGGMSLSEDGSFLLVTEEPNASGFPVVHRVSTTDGFVQNYTYAAATSGSFHDVEIVDTHTAILSGPQMVKLNLDTGTFSQLPNATFYSSSVSVLVEDQHLTLIAEPGISNGPLFIYDDRVGAIVARGDDYQTNVSSGYNFGHQAISEAAGQVAQYIGRAINFYDLSLHAIKTVRFDDLIDGLAYDKTGTYLYVYLMESSVLAKYSVATMTLVDQIAVGGSVWHNHIGSGDQIHISNDGSYITLSDTNAPPYTSGGGKLQLIDLTARNETFFGTLGDDTFYGKDGNDTYYVNTANDLVVENVAEGLDTVHASIASYALTANVENLIYDGTGSFTGTGNDLDNVVDARATAAASTLLGGSGSDTLYGGDGNDRLDGGTGGDRLFGRAGNDVYVYDPFDTIIENAGEGSDTIEAAVSYTLNVANVENITLIGSANIDATGDSGANTLTGNSGNNTLTGNGGIDTLLGGAGNDRLIVGAGGNGTAVDGGADFDTLVVTGSVTLGSIASIEAIELQNGANLTLTSSQIANGLASTLQLSGTGTVTVNLDMDGMLIGSPFSVAPGSAISVVVNGSSGNDYVKAVTGASNTLIGGDGNDFLRGGRLADIIDGGAGGDKITGFGGADILTGGGGTNQFRYLGQSDSGLGVDADHITDFTVGVDRLDFRLFDTDPVAFDVQNPGFGFIADQAFHATGAAEIRYEASGNDLMVQVDVDGNGVADMAIYLNGLHAATLSSADFMLI